MNLTLKDLRVETPAFAESQRTTAGVHNRPASLADLVEVLKQEGAETIWWCEPHEVGEPQQASRCWRGVIAADLEERTAACRMVRMILIPGES